MMGVFGLLSYTLIQFLGLGIAFATGAVLLFLILRKIYSRKIAALLLAFCAGVFLFFFVPRGLPQAFEYPFQVQTFGPGAGPGIPFAKIAQVFTHQFERVDNIAAHPARIPQPITRRYPETVRIELEAKEVLAEMAPGVVLNYWTFGGQVPGPFLRVREGDTVVLTLKNHPSSLHYHNIDLHAVTGPGGGAVVTNVAPGDERTLTFKALNPGLYVYHCAHPNVSTHMAHGMYGLILVEPEAGLPPADREFYVMQGEFYTTGKLGQKGFQVFDAQKMLDGQPEYIVFNGKTKSLFENMAAAVGEKVRLYVGNGGVNLISSFHVIGEIFDDVYPEASIGGDVHHNVQTTLVPAGGAAITDFRTEIPGNFVLVDHALARLDRGAWGLLQVNGERNAAIFDGNFESHDHSAH